MTGAAFRPLFLLRVSMLHQTTHNERPCRLCPHIVTRVRRVHCTLQAHTVCSFRPGETVSHCTCSPHFTAPNKKSRLTATLDFGAIWLPSPRVLVVAAIHLHRLNVRRASSCAGDMWRAAHGNSCNCTHDEGSGSICVPDEDLLIRERADNS